MPELPEVETVARGLHKRVTGDVIESVWLGRKPEPLKSTAPEIAGVLGGSRIGGVRRVGKHIVFDLEQNLEARRPRSTKGRKPGPARRGSETRLAQASQTTSREAQWIVHLGMTGRLQLCEPKDEILKHTHA